jgi:hypothetical protein
VPTEEQLAKYRRLLAEHAKEPVGWGRNLRYRLGRMLCGRRPFAAHLDREKWTSVLRQTPRPATRNRLLRTPQVVVANPDKRKIKLRNAA